MQQLGFTENGITLASHIPEDLLRHIVSEVAIAELLLPHTHPRHEFFTIGRRIIMACPDLVVFWQTEQLSSGLVEGSSTTAREVASCGS
jgi:hypothetical protein